LDIFHEEMLGARIRCASEVMPVADWVIEFQCLLKAFTGMEPDQDVIESLVERIVPTSMPPTRGVMHLLLRTSVTERICGRTLAAEAGRRAMEEISELLLPGPSSEDLGRGVRQDLAQALGQLARAAKTPRDGDTSDVGPPCKRSRTASARLRLLATKTAEVRFTLANRLAYSRVPQTLEDAEKIIAELRTGVRPERDDDEQENFGLSRHSLVRHTWILDMAIDSYIKEDIYHRRLSGNFLGVSIATDESPPGCPRLAGLRFQVTNVYLGFVSDKAFWETSEDPPIQTRGFLADICHCPGKTGEDLMKVLDKELGRSGLTRADIISGTGDGGGENEGKAGFHNSLEGANPSYARRRCLPHIAWRTSDVAIAASKDTLSDYKAIAQYLTDGVTWRRLRAVATKSIEDGGIALFFDGSSKCHEVFHKSPSAIVSGRPHTDLVFLQLLRGKEDVLARLGLKDIEQRGLAEATKKVVESFRFADQNVFRSVLCEVLHRTHFLYFWNAAHPQVAAVTTLEDILDRAIKEILDLAITDEVLGRFGTNHEFLEEKDWRPRHWVELAVLLVVQDKAAAEERLPEALAFHRALTDKAASHLSLLAENLLRTHWQAAALLSKDAQQAQGVARTLLRRLDNAAPDSRTAFEKHLFEEPTLWDNLGAFAGARPPVRLWHGRGRFEPLFRWLATLFLVGPDHVLDCERIHARWQWICATKHAIQLPLLNASLKVTHYMDRHDGNLPADEALEPHL